MIAVAGLVAFLAILAGVAAWSALRGPPPAVTRIAITPEKNIHIGDPVTVEMDVRLPWGRLPRSVTVPVLPEEVQALAGGPRRPAGLGWLVWTWRCRVVLQPLAAGRFDKLQARVLFTPGPQTAQPALDVTLPGIVVEPRAVKPGETPVAAPTLRDSWWERFGSWKLAAGLIFGALLLWALVSLWMRKAAPGSGPSPPPAWVRALRDLTGLEAALPLPAEPLFVRLTDLVRSYCEERFGLRATEATTPEFMRMLRDNPLLTQPQQERLGDMLGQADAIKFARGQATPEQMITALASARRFVEETIPADQPREALPK